MDLESLNKLFLKISTYSAKLLPVVKNRSSDEIKFLYDFGIRDFGENRIDDYEKHKNFFPDVNYHFIAPIQSRKLKFISQNFDTIHTLQRKKEIDLLSKLQPKNTFFLQINIDNDINKSGFNVDSLFYMFEYCLESSILPSGLMTIPNINSDPRKVFSNLSKLNETLKKDYPQYKGELSMGMSDDYQIALDYGATIVRIGTKLFK